MKLAIFMASFFFSIVVWGDEVDELINIRVGCFNVEYRVVEDIYNRDSTEDQGIVLIEQLKNTPHQKVLRSRRGTVQDIFQTYDIFVGEGLIWKIQQNRTDYSETPQTDRIYYIRYDFYGLFKSFESSQERKNNCLYEGRQFYSPDNHSLSGHQIQGFSDYFYKSTISQECLAFRSVREYVYKRVDDKLCDHLRIK